LTGTGGRAPAAGADTVFFLSDYGRGDEFVGVVHAVLRRMAPAAVVIDLCHEVAPFDVAAGAGTLARAYPHLGPGVVLAVVDPGVGGRRRAVVVEVPAGTGPHWLVGPDNGLLWPAIRAASGAVRAVELPAPAPPGSATFDGRDRFAPAAAALCGGADPADLGPTVEVASLARLGEPVVEVAGAPGGRRRLRAEVTWVDRFGNAQLSAPGDLVPPTVGGVSVGVGDGGGPLRRLRRVRAFSDLEPGEAGVLVDANGRLALVVREGSAADEFKVAAGSAVEAVW
jgi:S-adenosylmethionine hydrolase